MNRKTKAAAKKVLCLAIALVLLIPANSSVIADALSGRLGSTETLIYTQPKNLTKIQIHNHTKTPLDSGVFCCKH